MEKVGFEMEKTGLSPARVWAMLPGYVAGALEADSCGLGSQLIVFASCVTVGNLAPRSELHLLCTQNWGNPVLSHGSWENGMRNRK